MKNYKKYAWYFPNWHVDPLNEKWHGTGWTEWEVTKCARPRFEGHIQPKVPVWGYESESDPEVFAKKIKAAKDYGFDGFIFDYYHFKDLGPYRRECLERGFLGAENSHQAEFGIMWCNHDPIYVHPAQYRHDGVELASGDADSEFFHEITDYCIKNYFPKENYIKVNGKAYFGIWNISKLIDNFGSPENLAKELADFRRRAKDAGFDLYITACKVNMPHYEANDKEAFNSTAKLLGIDSIFTYSWVNPEPEIWPTVEYSEVRKLNAELYYKDSEFSEIPHEITISVGWDCSPRTVQSDMYEDTGYPYTPINVGDTPEEIELAFASARDFAESDHFTGNFITVATWNEWTEGNYMEPDETYGYGYLEAFKRIFGGNND